MSHVLSSGSYALDSSSEAALTRCSGGSLEGVIQLMLGELSDKYMSSTGDLLDGGPDNYVDYVVSHHGPETCSFWLGANLQRTLNIGEDLLQGVLP